MNDFGGFLFFLAYMNRHYNKCINGDLGLTITSIGDFTRTSVGVNTVPIEINSKVTIPRYSRILFMNYGSSSDGALLAIQPNGKTITAFRNGNIWDTGVSDYLIRNSDLAATAKSYTPVFTWSNSGTAPTVKNIQVRYSVMAKICFIYARYEITSLGNPGDNDYLKVSLPEGIIPVFEPLSMISEYQTDSELPKVLGVRTMPDGYLHVVEGVGGGYSGSYIPTGYQGFSAFFMFK